MDIKSWCELAFKIRLFMSKGGKYIYVNIRPRYEYAYYPYTEIQMENRES